MALKLITAPTVLPVSVADAKLSCRFDSSALDTDIEDMIKDAQRLTEHETGVSLTQSTWEVSLDSFPEAIELTRVPVASITSIKYKDLDGVEQTLSSGAYALDAQDAYGFAYVVPLYGTTWPDTRDEINAVKVQFVAGVATAAEVPSHLRRKVKIYVAQMLDDPAALGPDLEAISKIYAT